MLLLQTALLVHAAVIGALVPLLLLVITAQHVTDRWAQRRRQRRAREPGHHHGGTRQRPRPE